LGRDFDLSAPRKRVKFAHAAWRAQAIELDPTNHVLFSNRSAAYLQAGDAESALEDAEVCVGMNATWWKGFSRKGAALHAMGLLEDAKAAYEEGLATSPGNPALQDSIRDIDRALSERSRPRGSPLGSLFSDPRMLGALASNPKIQEYLKVRVGAIAWLGG
jgi:stress-induced-phosphoprotein 1